MVVLGRLLMDDTIEGLRQTIRGYRGILEDAGVHVTHADVDEWHNSRARLLAVARAAADAFPELRTWIDSELQGTKLYKEADENMAGWEAALAAVEDLL